MSQNNPHDNEKLYSIFEHELAVEAIPYKDLFVHEPYKGYLFEEFRFAELKPCPWLYREKFISNEEYCNAEFTSEFRNRLSQIQNKFYDERINNSLEQQFFCPDLMKTPIAAILKKIKDEHEYFKKDFDDKKFDIYVESISNALNSISKIDLRNEVAEKLIADDFSIYDFDKIVSGYPEWGKRKFEFNHLIKKNLQDGTPEGYEKNTRKGRPKKIVDENMSLKEICYDGLYEHAREYYQRKIKTERLKKALQYGQLIREFSKKDWIKTEYKKPSPEQMQVLIKNEFNVNVSKDTARRNPKGNEFADLKERKTIQLPM